jgi:predicted RecA/RadA family phage recombinase
MPEKSIILKTLIFSLLFTGYNICTNAQVGIDWTIRTSASDNSWRSVTYGNGLFVAVSSDGSGDRVMTSPDGINWTSQTSAADKSWQSVTYGNGLFVAVGSYGGVMTSPNGINWTSRTDPANNSWRSVTFGNDLFVAVSEDGSGNRVMTSPDGINWTIQTSTADNLWYGVTYGNGLFVAVAANSNIDKVMTSPDGISWSNRAAPNNAWNSVTYGNELFVAVAQTGSGTRVMTSPDGINWTTRTSAANNNWSSVTFGNDLFVAVSFNNGTGNRIMTSPDGINWTIRTSAADNNWRSVTVGNGIFVAVANTGSGNRVMTSGTIPSVLPVRFSSFSGKNINNSNQLQWQTNSETNNNQFDIERSRDGHTFENAGSIPGAGNSTSIKHYSFTDSSPFSGTNYYRIKQTDFDGRFEYSKIIALINKENKSLSIFPNPAEDRVFISGLKNKNAAFTISNDAGQVMLKGKIDENNSISVATLKTGRYTISIENIAQQFLKR